ncbi:MAG: methionine--tRNA ligase subunit beta [Candidatus Omnitrophota bacterium]
MITIEEFRRLELKVAEIKEVNDHPNADRLYVITLDTGEGARRQVVAGIKNSYTKEELVGKQVVAVTNLAPALLRGVESNGMILAASDESGIRIIIPERKVALGSTVK